MDEVKLRIRNHDGEGRQPTNGAVMTHDEVAAELGICRQRVVQLEQSALNKLRNHPMMQGLKP